ncbi:hypothetical protein BOTBODRAFT_491413 [Botryobasidium botryosum FD-172 SS1]|uniref:Uncharacterized protein n=1 Tax=Botryobasidium botryosum (strain FD-172 SS1) TaxID=930990 RepID=A0A067M4A4_BOTB1|nr:hypothetical protein BOTBODRAFT_491413 [Botryobasidium botryosum FD-172 SS1]
MQTVFSCLCATKSAHIHEQPIELTTFVREVRQDFCGMALRSTFGIRVVPLVTRRAPALHLSSAPGLRTVPLKARRAPGPHLSLGKCDILHMHSQAILNAINMSGADIEGLDRVKDRFITLMEEVFFSIRYWANLDCYETLIHQFDIDLTVKERLRRLDACFAELSVASSMGPQWAISFASAQEDGMHILQRALERQQNPEKWRNAYEKLLDNILKRLQIVCILLPLQFRLTPLFLIAAQSAKIQSRARE